MIEMLLDLFGFVYAWLFEWFFGNTGRLLIKAFTFGQVDLDLDRWLPCLVAVVVGLIFWATIFLACLWWQYPEFFDFLNQFSHRYEKEMQPMRQ